MDKNNQICMSCIHFKSITDFVGYCTLLGGMVEKEVLVVDKATTIDAVHDTDEQRIYYNIVVQHFFGCVFHEKINVL